MRQNPDFVARQVGGELVLVPVTRAVSGLDSVFTLNPVGARIWELVETCATAEEIAAQLAEEFEVTPAEALADVTEFLAQLREIQALVED